MKVPIPVRRKHARIEIIPLIDIMFFLLASFMMVSLQLDRSQNVHVDLPAASTAHHDFEPKMLNIAVDKTGHPWLEKKEISLPDLAQVVSNRFRVDTNLPVYISGDRDTLHGSMADVLEIVRAAGVQNISFMVSEPKNEVTQ